MKKHTQPDWPALRGTVHTLADLLALPRRPLRGGLEELARGDLSGGCFRLTPELRRPWCEGLGSRAEVIRCTWFNVANPDDGELYIPDARRFWRLAVLVHEGVPCLLAQNSGREGDDYADRVILDPDAYLSALWAQGAGRNTRTKLRRGERRRLADAHPGCLVLAVNCDPIPGAHLGNKLPPALPDVPPLTASALPYVEFDGGSLFSKYNSFGWR